MARKTIVTCDRCGASAEDAQNFTTLQLPSKSPIVVREPFMDLCASCFGELVHFLKASTEPTDELELGPAPEPKP